MELGVLESGERGRRGDGAVPAVALGATKEVADPDAREAPAGEPLQPWDDDGEEGPASTPMRMSTRGEPMARCERLCTGKG